MFNKRAEVDATKLIIGLVFVVAVLVVIAYELGVTQQQINTGVNEVNITNTGFNETIKLANQRIVSGSMVALNSTCRQAATCTGRNGTLTEGNEFSVDETNGRIKFINRTGQWNLTYNNKPEAYADSALTRTVLSFVAVFAGLLGLVFVARGIGNNK